MFAASCVPLARYFESLNPAGLRNSFDRLDYDVSAFSLVIGLYFVLSLYKRDTTRMVGRIFNSTAMHTSLLYPRFSLISTLLSYISFILSPPPIRTQTASHLSPHIYLHSLHLIYPSTCTHTTYISLIPPQITTQRTSYLFPHLYTCTARISLNIYPHSLHLINPPTNNYTAYISFIPLHIYLHYLHLIYPLHIPTKPASHSSAQFNS